MKKLIIALLGIVFLFIFLTQNLLLTTAKADESFFSGKSLRIVVGFKPGGGYDQHARLVGSHIGKYIPGHPKVIVVNMVGLNREANFLYREAKPDGLTIGIVRRGVTTAQALGMGPEHSINFDATKFSWLGSTSSSSQVIFVRTDSGIKNFDDLRNLPKPLRVSYGTPGGTDMQEMAHILLPFMGAKVELFPFPGGLSTAERVMAMDRGELQLIISDWDGIQNIRKNWIEDGFITLIAKHGAPHQDPRLAKLPSTTELAQTPLAKKLISVINDWARAGRPFAAPPGVPLERLNILSKAFEKTLQDIDFLATAKRMNIEIDYLDGQQVRKVIDNVINLEPEVKKAWKEMVFKAWDWKQ